MHHSCGCGASFRRKISGSSQACERLGITEPNIGVRHLVLDCKREMTKL
ncbi:Uncharacterised protein [uncultured Blautia sp.]|nr:Uncharacterised protein [uncultured Blautia sp.]